LGQPCKSHSTNRSERTHHFHCWSMCCWVSGWGWISGEASTHIRANRCQWIHQDICTFQKTLWIPVCCKILCIWEFLIFLDLLLCKTSLLSSSLLMSILNQKDSYHFCSSFLHWTFGVTCCTLKQQNNGFLLFLLREYPLFRWLILEWLFVWMFKEEMGMLDLWSCEYRLCLVKSHLGSSIFHLLWLMQSWYYKMLLELLRGPEPACFSHQ